MLDKNDVKMKSFWIMKATTLRISEEIYSKIEALAKIEQRSINKQLVFLIEESLKRHEHKLKIEQASEKK